MAPALGTGALSAAWRRTAGALAQALALALLLAAGPAAANDAPRADEAEVRAAVIYNLLLFVRWPHQAAPPPFRLCVADDGALTAALRRFAGKTVHGRPQAQRRLGPDGGDMADCDAVVVEGGNPAALARAVAAARERPLLVIAEGSRAVERGAAIGVHSEGGRAVFDINTGALQRSGLAASAQILRLARNRIDAP